MLSGLKVIAKNPIFLQKMTIISTLLTLKPIIIKTTSQIFLKFIIFVKDTPGYLFYLFISFYLVWYSRSSCAV